MTGILVRFGLSFVMSNHTNTKYFASIFINQSNQNIPTAKLSTPHRNYRTQTKKYTMALKSKNSTRAKPPSRRKSRSDRAGLKFPVGRIARLLRAGKYCQRIGDSAPVFLAAVLEYLVAEVLELAGNAAHANHKTRIVPRHLQLAIRNDVELSHLLSSVTIAQGGVLPHIHDELLKTKKTL